MILCFFVSDLHGNVKSYQKLFKQIKQEKPDAVFLGGDLLPSGMLSFNRTDEQLNDFLKDFLVHRFSQLLNELRGGYPDIFIILGNDDSRINEQELVNAESMGIWKYVHNKKIKFKDFSVYGYAHIPPTPFLLKDWERYDVSRYVDPGCVSPEDGWRSKAVETNHIKYATIKNDLELLSGQNDLSKSIFLFHTPPYQTCLDRAALDGKKVDHVPLDVHVGSIAVKKFIEKKQPLITLHGHIHESASITGQWKEQIENTFAFSAAHDGPELSLVRFYPENPHISTRVLI